MLEALAGVDVRTAEPEWPARLLAGAAALREAIDAPVPPIERPALERVVAQLRARLPDDTLRAGSAAGRAIATEALVAAALGQGASAQLQVVEPAAALEVTAFGSARVRMGARLLTAADFSYAKPRELLFYLLDHTDRSKDQIGAALWPWASRTQLRSAFHTTLHHLRDALGDADRIVFHDGRYALDRSKPYRYDVETFEACLTRARGAHDPAGPLAEAADVYRGDYLADLVGESWVDERREYLRRAVEQSLLTLGQLHLAAGRLDDAAQTFRRVIGQDPLLETAHRELMRVYAAGGDHAQALRHFRTLSALLHDELGARPAPDTLDLHARIRRGEPM